MIVVPWLLSICLVLIILEHFIHVHVTQVFFLATRGQWEQAVNTVFIYHLFI